MNGRANERKSVPNRYINLWVLDLYTKYINSTRVNRNLSAVWSACIYVCMLENYDITLNCMICDCVCPLDWEVVGGKGIAELGRGGDAAERGSSDTQTDKNREDNDIPREAGGQADIRITYMDNK